MRLFLLLGITVVCFLVSVAYCDISVSYTINTETGRAPISPYIYGYNFDHVTGDNLTVRRMGGNRLTGYNWENNFSNAGSDWQHYSDTYMSNYLPANQRQDPGRVMYDFVDDSLTDNQASVITLQMAGYVSADGNGAVDEIDTAPSARWIEVVPQKPTAFSNPAGSPDTTDDYVYMDEFVNYLVSEFGDASTANGVKFYALDNEPALWLGTHPRIHPLQPTCVELIQKSTALSSAVKDVDLYAQICGPTLYGFGAYNTFQSAPDWDSVKGSRSWFIDYYLDEMKDAGTLEGRRLLDILDLHWYSEAYDDNDVRITNYEATETNWETRMQAPRSLWDPDYIENSWIGEWFSHLLPLIPTIQNSIDTYYPGTGLAFTEYSHGGENHISGGIAQADVLGIFGKYGVTLSSYWGGNGAYMNAAFQLYRDYDGNQSTFGDTKVTASMSDKVNSSIYAATFTDNDAGMMSMVVLNKNLTEAIAGTFTLSSLQTFASGRVWAFDETSSTITERTSVSSITGNTFSYSVPALTACIFVLQTECMAANIDGIYPINLNDFAMLAANWQLSGTDLLGDINSDGTVNGTDLTLMATYWLSDCSQ